MAGEYITKVPLESLLDSVEHEEGQRPIDRAIEVDKRLEQLATAEFTDANPLAARDIAMVRGKFFLYVTENVEMPVGLRMEMRVLADNISTSIRTGDAKGIHTLLTPLTSRRRSETGHIIEQRGNRIEMLAQKYFKTKPH